MILTYSSLECFKACRKKYSLRYLDCITLKQKSNALEFGSAIHAVLEQYLKQIDCAQKFGRDDLESVKSEIMNCAGEVIDSFKLDTIDASKFIGLISGYIRSWFDSDFEQFEIINVEKEFAINAIDNITFVGKVDGLVRRKDNGKYFIVEHKTASFVDDSYIKQKDIDSQTMTYALCLQNTLGIKISGCIHDIIIKQKIKIKKNESVSDFCDRLFADVTKDNFVRIVVEFGEEILKDFESELVNSCLDVYQCKKYYKCTGNCLGRYGCCEYMPICRAGGMNDSLLELFDIKRAHEEISQETINSVTTED